MSTRTWTLRQCDGMPLQTPRCSFVILSSELFCMLWTLWSTNDNQITQVKNEECLRPFFSCHYLLIFILIRCRRSTYELQISAWVPKAESAKPCSCLTVLLHELALLHVAGLCLLVLAPETLIALWTGILSANFMGLHDWQQKQELGDATLSQRLYARSTTGWFIQCNIKGSPGTPKSCCHSCRVILPLHIHLLKLN